ncbi:hypothetical protein COLO4_33064 [Corchorus olitorius]|uniref:Uncharacterized protein n=1 Tax=Corchorus olitorius TaxID=93759 RepID=A0A1R3GWH2_9ROSI|nr:hypothetical protein COLO4_33064 [Corchorus olitorius]
MAGRLVCASGHWACIARPKGLCSRPDPCGRPRAGLAGRAGHTRAWQAARATCGPGMPPGPIYAAGCRGVLG